MALEGCRYENRPYLSVMIIQELTSLQAVGFEILYQESKGKLSTSNITLEGTKSSVSFL